MFKKFTKWIVLIVILVLIAFVYILNFSPKKVAWGVTFSQQYAQDELGLDWNKTYIAILDDLKVDHIRLSAYWNGIEPAKGNYDFTDLDWQINEASKRNVKIILAVGRRLPRWPECHDPNWIKNMDIEDVQARQLEYVERVVRRYDGNKNIVYWQVENEPYLKYFGQCPPLDKKFFKKEISLVKTISQKKILVTDSGELSLWFPAANSGADVLGTTLYRVVYNKTFGYWKWFLPASFYWMKSVSVEKFTPIDDTIVAELQGEAWHKAGENLSLMSMQDSFESMSIDQFKENIKFAKKAGFNETYLWGVEWWYMMKEKNSYDGYWSEARKLWQ
ncbi:MAG: beta-galactosidase [Candidatus Buchananbacteria bacterium]